MLDWFTTIPGILIISGVVFLILAIILFIVGNKKEKTSKSNDNMVIEPIVEASEAPIVTEPVMETVDAPIVTEPVVEAVDAPIVTEPVMETVDAPVVTEPVMETTAAPVVTEPVMETTAAPVVTEPVMEAVDAPVVPTFEVNPEPATISIPAMEEVQQPALEPVTTSNTIYGGASVNYTFEPENKPVSIYGGNDPLEATQTLPKVEEHHAPYGIEEPVVKTDIEIQPFEIHEEPIVSIPEPQTEEIKPIEIVTEPIVEPVQPVIDTMAQPIDLDKVEEL